MAKTLILDAFLPTNDHVVSVSRVFRAPPEKVFEAADVPRERPTGARLDPAGGTSRHRTRLRHRHQTLAGPLANDRTVHHAGPPTVMRALDRQLPQRPRPLAG